MVESIEQRLKKDGRKLQEKTLRLGQLDEITYSIFYSAPMWAIFIEDKTRFGKLFKVFRNPDAAAEKWLELTEENQGILDWLESYYSNDQDKARDRIIYTPAGVMRVRSGFDFKEGKDGSDFR